MLKEKDPEEELWFYLPDNKEPVWKGVSTPIIKSRRRWNAWDMIGLLLTISASFLFLVALFQVGIERYSPNQPPSSSSVSSIVLPDAITLTPDLSATAASVQPTTSFRPLATPTVSLFPTRASTEPQSDSLDLDVESLQDLMLDLINQDRVASGLGKVEWDETAAQAGVVHAQDMLENGYFSHWNLVGLGPDHRYSLAGGKHAVMENLHAFSYTFENGRGAPVEDWEAVIVQAQEGLMNSPGHRANILDPAHTHVGIGMAYDAATGQFYLAQEFTNQYVILAEDLPLTAMPGSNLSLRGHVDGEDLSRLLFSLAYEPFPAPLSLQELAQRSTYTSPAESVEVQAIDLVFHELVTLGDQPGLYHIRLFVDIARQQALVMDHVVWVDQP